MIADPDRPIHPYHHADGSPRLRNSWVLYLDALGTSERANAMTDDGLRERFDPEVWYHRFLYHGNISEHRRALYFTDNVAIGVPADQEASGSLHSLADLLYGVAPYVVGMAIEANIAIRGAVVFGPAYIDNHVVADPLAPVQVAHGSALVEAVHLEEAGGPPRVVIGTSALSEVERLRNAAGSRLVSRPTEYWLNDEGTVFLDHLGMELAFEPALPLRAISRTEVLERYAHFIRTGMSRSEEGIVGKYQWLAAYHDFSVSRYGLGDPTFPGQAKSFNAFDSDHP